MDYIPQNLDDQIDEDMIEKLAQQAEYEHYHESFNRWGNMIKLINLYIQGIIIVFVACVLWNASITDLTIQNTNETRDLLTNSIETAVKWPVSLYNVIAPQINNQ